MRLSIVFLFLLSFFCVSSQAQTNRTWQAGIYKSFSEFEQNTPSVKLNWEVKLDSVKYGNLGNRKFMNTYLLAIPKVESKNIGEVFGFSDGTHFYIADYPHNLYNFAFYMLEPIGAQYLFFESLKETQYGEMHLSNTLNMTTGAIDYLTNNRFKKILADKPDLYTKYMKEEDKSAVWKQYLTEYQKK